MSAAFAWWIIIVAVAVINFLSRLSFIAVFARVDMPPLVGRALRFVPAAMLTAIVVPPIVFATPATLAFSYTNPKLVAALVAAAIAWRTKNVTLTIAAGMAALWAVQWLLRALG
jgi:branched-subunit amino acid transport protein